MVAKKQAKVNSKNEAVTADMGSPNSEPQWKFFLSTAKYTCYGGAKGGGKSWAIVRKAALGAYQYPGIKIIMVRREYEQMENPIIQPMLKILAPGTFNYNKTEHLLTFTNGSQIKFGNMPDYTAATEGKYQGQSHDWLFIDEATQFTEQEFRGLCSIVRGDSKIPKRVYLTCNPGGVGHFWVKRLFVDRQFKPKENPKDYVFIPATVDDNKDINQDYIDQLELLPEDIYEAHRFGNWNVLSGVYFSEFQDGVHTCKPFPLKQNWQKYRAMDYGLDMFFCIWVAVDETGRCYVYREFAKNDMIVSEAAQKQLELTRPDERIDYTIAPPDMWSRNNETGKTRAALFMENGVGMYKADNNRIQGWAALKELLKIRPDGKPGLIIFDTCSSLIECVKCIQHDKQKPDDVSKEPHGITHGPDALRYFAQTRVLPAEVERVEDEEDEDEEGAIDYQTAMCGGKVTNSYLYA